MKIILDGEKIFYSGFGFKLKNAVIMKIFKIAQSLE
jgi:hypothetical protein